MSTSVTGTRVKVLSTLSDDVFPDFSPRVPTSPGGYTWDYEFTAAGHAEHSGIFSTTRIHDHSLGSVTAIHDSTLLDRAKAKPAAIQEGETPRTLSAAVRALSAPCLKECGDTMTDAVIKQHQLTMSIAASFVEDTSVIILQDVTKNYLEKLCSEAEVHRKDLANAICFLEIYDKASFKGQTKSRAVDTKLKLMEFIRDSQAVLAAAPPPTTAGAGNTTIAARVKAARVHEFKDAAASEVQKLIVSLDALTEVDPCSDAEVVTAEQKFYKLCKKCDQATKELKSLASDAIDAGLEESALELDKIDRELKDARTLAEATIESLKEKFGIVFGAAGGATKLVDLKPPVFHGDGSGDDHIDFFTFQNEYKEFVNSKNLTFAEQLLLLKNTCLVGPPKIACKDLKSVDEVMTHLKQFYGNPRILMNNALEEVKKLGGCPFSYAKRRHWAISLLAKMKYLKDIAVKFQLEESLYPSQLIENVRAALPKDARKDLMTEMRPFVNEFGVIPRSIIYENLMIFLEEFIQQSTFEINFSLGLEHSEEDNNTKHRPKKQTKTFSNQQQQRSSSPPAAAAVQPKKRWTKSAAATCQSNTSSPAVIQCVHCSGKHTHLFYCEKFQRAEVRNRIKLTMESKVCFRCLRMDSGLDLENRTAWYDQHKVNCDTEFGCTQQKCNGPFKNMQRHITMCVFHIKVNKTLESKFISSLDKKLLPPNGVKFFYMDGFYHSSPGARLIDADDTAIEPDIGAPAIFMLQTVGDARDRELTVFYDSGCGGAAISYRGSEILGARVVREGPTLLQVASGGAVELPDGDDMWHMDQVDTSKKATFSGVKMEYITSEFPLFQLSDAFSELQREYKKLHPEKRPLPSVGKTAGGARVDVMIGIRYRRYFPVLLFELPSGLAIYSAKLKSARGCQGILGGPHKSWMFANSVSMVMGPSAFLAAEVRSYRVVTRCLVEPVGCQVDEEDDESMRHESSPDCQNFDIKCEFKHCVMHEESANWKFPLDWNLDHSIHSTALMDKIFTDAEELGTVAEYRCVVCRNCPNCKRGEVLENVSLKEESEQALIEASVVYNKEERILEVTLPFVQDPAVALTPNRNVAMKVLETQLKNFSKHPEMREDVLASHEKLAARGHVCRVSDLSPEQKAAMDGAPGSGYFLPWRSVYKSSSLSTPCRLVFDASARTPGGESLNNILPKGQNKLMKIQHLLLQFRAEKHVFCFDVQMAYNNLKLRPEFYKFQRYLWMEGLDEGNPVVDMVVKTAIYGVRPAGGQCQEGFIKLGMFAAEEYPDRSEGAEILINKMYVDDGAGGADTMEECLKLSKDVEFVLSLASMKVKDFTFSGNPPSDSVSVDGEAVGVLGYVWRPEEDVVLVDSKQLFFGKVRRGLKPEPVYGDVKEALSKCFTRRTILSKIAGVFDPLGLVTPITAKFKLDLQDLVRSTVGWDDPAPSSMLELWADNLQKIKKIGDVQFRRSIIPPNAASPEIELIVSVDASMHIAIAVIHSRIPTKDGKFHVQLVGAKSKVITGTTVPKSELKAAVLGSVFSHVVKMNIKNFAKIYYVTDSTIVLHWINQDSRPMHTMVRNCVIEIRRFTLPQQWFHIDTEDNIADLGTRGAKLEDILPGTEWQCGKAWMALPADSLPLKMHADLCMSAEEKAAAAAELKAKDVFGHVLANLKNQVSERYSFSKYIIDPCSRPWPKILRIVGYVIKFIEVLKLRISIKLSSTVPEPSMIAKKNENVFDTPSLDDVDLAKAERYFFLKGTKEVKHFSKPKDWKYSTFDDNGVLVYKGRILEGQEINDVEQVMTDLSPCQFVKPVLDRYSPLSYSIMIFSHRELTRHRNASATLLESRTVAFILSGRDLAIEIRESCTHCTRYRVKLSEAEMGKMHEARLTIAPIFYHVQVDLMGPFSASCEHNHRSTVKVWGAIYKDPATCAVAAFVMQSYSTAAFLQTYIRFSTRFGHPKKLFIDEGSQLIKACKEMEIHWADLSNTLNSKYGVGIEYETSPVGAHYATGQVERSIKEIKKLFFETYNGLKLDVLSYETGFNWTCNELNCMPICLGNRYNNIDHLDLITPSRLMHGRNNRRSPTGTCLISGPSRLLSQLQLVYESWWRVWMTERLVDFIPQPAKWRETKKEPVVGDVVIFIKDESDGKYGSPTWKLGRVKETIVSKDGVIRVVVLEYRNPDEKVFRVTRRSVRKIAVIHRESDLDLIDELNQASKMANINFLLNSKEQ